MVLARSTELEAVNRVLQMMGEAPVNSLSGQFGLAKQAQDTLTNVSRQVQAEGWSFNTDYEVTMNRNSSNEIVVGANVSRVVVDIYEFPDYDVIQKNNMLYDRRGQTSVFTEDLKADITYMLDWDDLPEHAHQYIMTRAGRQLQESIVGSTDLGSINLTAESEARSQFLEEETTKSEHNMLRGNPNHTGVFQTYIPSRALIR